MGTRFGKYCRAFLAGSLAFGGVIVASVIGGSLTASAATQSFALTVDAPPTLCTPGSYSASGYAPCTLAPPGTEVSTTGATSATDCAAGTYSPNYGDITCTLAPPGTEVSTTGATSATDCAAGTYSPNYGDITCTLAPPGTFVDTTGAAAATDCSLGYYSAYYGSINCTAAPPGTYVGVTGSSTYTDCGLGTYQPNSGQISCFPAPTNTYVDTEGATSATPCPPGTFTLGTGSTSSAACLSVVVTNPGDQSDYINAPITALTNSENNGIAPVSWSATGLPAGLTIDPTTGTITGTPTTPCTCSVTLTATDADNNTGSANFTWSILPFGIATTSLPDATPGTKYSPSVTLEAAGLGVSAPGYTTTLKWAKVSLPEGLKLSSKGVLSGTPNKNLAAGLSSVTVKVTETVTTLNGRRKVKTKTTAEATIPLTIT